MGRARVLVLALLGVGALACGQDAPEQAPPPEQVVVYYLHGTFRCKSCNLMEQYARESVEGAGQDQPFADQVKAGRLRFQPVNADLKENQELVKRLQAESKSIVVVRERAGAMVETRNLGALWDLLGEREKFLAHVRKAVREALAAGEPPKE